MKIILLYVSSIDGKLTKWGQSKVHNWTSPEDAEYFLAVRKQNNLIVMGSKTFNAVKPNPEEGTLRIVMTEQPKKYQQYALPGQIEFSNESPERLVNRLETQYKQMILLSGKTLSTAFLKKKLVNELWLTIEPKIFGIGDPLVTEEKLDIQLQLIKLQKLNRKGTLLIKYKVEK